MKIKLIFNLIFLQEVGTIYWMDFKFNQNVNLGKEDKLIIQLMMLFHYLYEQGKSYLSKEKNKSYQHLI